MMNVLWLVNIKLPRISELQGENPSQLGGWLTGLSDSILQNDECRLTVLYPEFETTAQTGENGSFRYYGINVNPREYYKGLLDIKAYIEIFREILVREKPDIIHIHGTEFTLAYALAEACEREQMLERVVVSIQGLVSIIAKHYYANLPERIWRSRTWYELLRRESLQDQVASFRRRGVYEEKLIQKVHHVIGRTDWDYACVKSINSDVNYHFCNEILRKEFYSGTWKYEECEKHSIFISQASSPLKGFHMLLEAVNGLQEKYPDLMIYVAGQNIISRRDISRNSYSRYLAKLIKKYALQDHITFCGMLNAEHMKAQMLRCSLFVCPSSIENSSNSLGEAMLLGMPCIASDVGGTRSMLKDRVEGLIYPFDECDLLKNILMNTFENENCSIQMGSNAQKRAQIVHDIQDNVKQMLLIYDVIVGKSGV